MKISKTHQKFANNLRNQRALDHPEEFLGPNWKDVLDFWLFLDTLTKEQWKIIVDRYWALDEDVRVAAHREFFNNAIYVSKENFCSLNATFELIGSHVLKKQGKSLVFLSLFSNL